MKAVRLCGSFLVAMTLIYALSVVLPAHAHGIYHYSDYIAKDLNDVPPMWKSNNPLGLVLGLVPILTGLLIPGGWIPVVMFLSCGMGFLLILDWTSFSVREKLFWLSGLLGSWLFFCLNFEVLELYRLWLLD